MAARRGFTVYSASGKLKCCINVPNDTFICRKLPSLLTSQDQLPSGLVAQLLEQRLSVPEVLNSKPISFLELSLRRYRLGYLYSTSNYHSLTDTEICLATKILHHVASSLHVLKFQSFYHSPRVYSVMRFRRSRAASIVLVEVMIMMKYSLEGGELEKE